MKRKKKPQSLIYIYEGQDYVELSIKIVSLSCILLFTHASGDNRTENFLKKGFYIS